MPSEGPTVETSRFQGKIFCIGAHRTGTNSLANALTMLGFRATHWVYHDEIVDAIRRKDYRLALMDTFDAASDLPIPVIYQQLDEAFPDAKFILTVRDVETWLRSVRRHTEGRDLVLEEIMFYGRTRFDAEAFVSKFFMHNREVRAHFAGRDSLLVLDVAGGDGWPQLAPFLGVHPPADEFPWRSRRSW